MKKELDTLTQPIINIFNAMETALLIDIAQRFSTYDSIGGSLEWQIKKLNELGSLNAEAVKTIATYSNKSEKEILKMLEEAGYANIDMSVLTEAYNIGQISVDPSKMMENPVMRGILEHSYKELGKTYKLIQTKALERRLEDQSWKQPHKPSKHPALSG